MATMVHRTTLSLDAVTIERIRKLSIAWGVSQAEVVRRSVEAAAGNLGSQQKRLLDRLRAYHDSGGLNSETAEAYLRQVAEDRAAWRGGP